MIDRIVPVAYLYNYNMHLVFQSHNIMRHTTNENLIISTRTRETYSFQTSENYKPMGVTLGGGQVSLLRHFQSLQFVLASPR